ncbi:hypothetical protein BGZ99_010267 [Dissophora globulifera]|uniref:Uncharacterized protein n=1 Tax=Dissophora globulifera TaxID=979702 RepID=A0A9P6R7B2_9FUNG|nr:hypothetical protein BGZ99_010267 [Dissophora globulifera]
MSITPTETTSFTYGFTTLSEEHQSPPVQEFRVGKEGTIVLIEAEWDTQLEKFCYHIDELENHLGVRVDHVKRAESGVYVNRLRGHNDEICEPHRYAPSSGILEVYTNTGPSPESNAYKASGIVNQFDRLHSQYVSARRARHTIDAAEYMEAMHQQYLALLHCKDDTANRVFVKTQELILYPVPRRFFVVLQKNYIVSKHLKLHLLCECGVYDYELDPALETDTTAPSEVDSAFGSTHDDDPTIGSLTSTHLSNHGGYKVKEPTKLCRDIGNYLLPVLKFLHYSAIFAGIVVPALASVNVSGWFKAAQSFVNYSNKSWSEPWLKTIHYVAGLSNVHVLLKEDEIELTMEDIPKAIDYPEYRQFKVHLKKLDPDEVFANLIPIFCNRSGRLKYVCKDHNDEKMKGEDLFDRLHTLGTVIAQNRANGELTFKIESKMTTEQFYDCLLASHGIRKVNIGLGSSTDAIGLKTLRKKLTEANIDNISLSGINIKTPGSWYKQTLKLMINQRCQSLTLVDFKDFYKHISGTKRPKTTRLKTLTLLCDFHISQLEKLKMILKLCPALRNLTIKATYSNDLCNDIQNELRHLKRLDFFSDTHTTITKITNDVGGELVYTTVLNVTDLRSIPPLTEELYSHLGIVRLSWLSDPGESLETWLAGALKHCSRLLALDLRVPLKYFDQLVTILKNEFEIANALHRIPDSRRIVRLRSMMNDHDVTMIVKFQGNVPDFEIDIEMTGLKESNAALETIFRNYGSCVRSLVANHLLDEIFLLSPIDTVVRNSSKLARLSIDATGLRDNSWIQTLVDLLPSPKEFTLSFSSLESEFRQDQFLTLVQRYGTQVSDLILRGADNTSDWISRTIPVRSRLPNLLHFGLAFEGSRGQFRNEATIRQVLQVISTPATATTAISSIVDVVPSSSLQSFSLSHCNLTPEQWSRVLIQLDLKALKHLSVEDTNFDVSELKLLIGRLPTPTAVPQLIQKSLALPLDELVIKDTPLVKDMGKLARLETQLLMRAPHIKVIID